MIAWTMRVMARLWEPEWYEPLGRYLRLQVHDSLLWCLPEPLVAESLPLIHQLMTQAVPELPMPPAWGLGPALSIDVEIKMGYRWGGMEEV